MSYGFRLPDSYYDPPDMPDIRELSHSTVTARKEHQCSWCKGRHGPIKVGEKYYRYVHIFEGEFRFDKIHRACYHGDDRQMEEEAEEQRGGSQASS